jgi:hypothetical protein
MLEDFSESEESRVEAVKPGHFEISEEDLSSSFSEHLSASIAGLSNQEINEISEEKKEPK